MAGKSVLGICDLNAVGLGTLTVPAKWPRAGCAPRSNHLSRIISDASVIPCIEYISNIYIYIYIYAFLHVVERLILNSDCKNRLKGLFCSVQRGCV